MQTDRLYPGVARRRQERSHGLLPPGTPQARGAM